MRWSKIEETKDLKIPYDELNGYIYELKNAQAEGDIKLPISEREIFWNYARETCRTNLYILNKCVLIHPSRDRLRKSLHGEMCGFYDKWYGYNKLFLVPRKHFKSTCITVGGGIQKVLREPGGAGLIINKVSDNAEGFLDEIKQHFESNVRLRALFPDICWENTNDSPLWSKSAISLKRIIDGKLVIRRDPSITANGIDGTLVSGAYEWITFDDLVDYDTVNSRDILRKTKDQFNRCVYLLNPNGTITVIGTRYGYDDLYNELLESGEDAGKYNWKKYVRRALEGPEVLNLLKLLEGDDKTAAEQEDIDVADVTEAIFQKGIPIFPKSDRRGTVEFSGDILKYKYLTKNAEVDFWMQMMNFPLEPKRQIFKMKHTTYWKDSFRNYVYRYDICDPAVGKNREGNNTVILSVFVDFEYTWFLGNDIICEILTPGQIIDAIADRIKSAIGSTTPIRAFGVEQYELMFKSTFEKKMADGEFQCDFFPLESHGVSKQQRILKLEPKWRQRQIRVPDTDQMKILLRDQIYRWRPNVKNIQDDLIDAMAYIFQLTTKYGYPANIVKKKWLEDFQKRKQKAVLDSLTVGNGIDSIMTT